MNFNFTHFLHDFPLLEKLCKGTKNYLHISKKSSNFAAESCKAYGTVSFFEDIYTRGHSFRCE